MLLDRISDILEMARIEAGLLEFKPQPLDFAEVLQGCVSEVSRGAREKRVALEFEHPTRNVTGFADHHAVRQIGLQLLSNAVKFTPAGGRVIASVRSTSTGTNVSVSDTGIGIPESELPRLTLPFEQVCAERYLAKKGQGLGLALVQALAEKHGGAMRIESAAGKGTTVHVEFPSSKLQTAA